MRESMICPVCAVPMVEGRVELRSSVAARLLTDDHGVGVRLHFVRARDAEARVAELGLAWGCESCDAVFVPGGGGSDVFECFECGTEIPADASACPACGWTW